MKIAWFTPFHIRSAIGEFSQHVVRELARCADVEIWTSDEAPLLDSDVPLVSYAVGSSTLERLFDYDAVVYNIGNYLKYHGDIYAVSREYPGIVVLHDRALQHLLADMWLMGPEADAPYYIERMGVHYGAQGMKVARDSLEGKRRPVWEMDDDLLRFPLYEECIINALGVITHSEEQANDIRSKWLGPVAALRLPCYSEVLARGSTRQSDDGRLRLLTMGHLNPNKQVLEAIEALAERPELAAQIKYRIVGSDGGFVAYRRSLQRLVTRHSHIDVEIVDWLPDDQLEHEMHTADVFVNLRHPNIEGASASLMKQLGYGKPVVCFDSGCFSEVPANAVLRVPVGNFDAVVDALQALAENRASRDAVGRQARKFAESCTEAAYVEGLLELIEQSNRTRPALEFLDRVASELGEMHADSRLPIFNQIANDFGRVLAF